MPLRQSRLNFGFGLPNTDLTALPAVSNTIQTTSATSDTSDIDADTIVVNTIHTHIQLPTPSESATDVSSQGSQNGEIKSLRGSRSKRVSSTRGARLRKSDVESLDIAVEEKNRSISGETLVSHSTSQANLVQMDLNETKLKASKDIEEDEAGSVITVKEHNEEEDVSEAEVEEQRAAKKAKREENAKKWEERKRAAEASSTRRSNRASLIGKAGDMISDFASSVVGKRPREVMEKSRDKFSELKSTIKSQASDTKIVIEEPAPKKQRTDLMHTARETTPITKAPASRREKKWLASGLYAGQVRTFDARLNESKNKRKSTHVTEPVKENNVIPLPMFAGERLLKHGRDFKLPFDVFSPLPAGQPKPDEWRRTNKNVFVGDAAQEWRTPKYVEHSTCLCREETGCDHNCMNRYMYYECDEKNCNLTFNQCGNRAFDGLKSRVKVGGKYNVGVEVIKTADRGYGVRSNRTFDPNQIIVEYTGEIITQEECERRMHTMYKDNECYYLMLFDQNMIIDATRGSIARFVNHSCEPNCRMEKWTVNGKPRMALFAGDRGVMTGEELTYDYNFDPYSQKNVQVCRCGARNCRGVLGPKPKEVKQKSPDTEIKSKKPEGRLAGAKRKVVEVLEESTNRLQKKRKIEFSSPARLVKAPAKSKHARAKSPTKVKVTKKITARRVSIPKTTVKKPGGSDSKLRKMVASVKGRTTVVKGKRVVSASSATEALLGEGHVVRHSKTLGRSSSLKEKAASLRKNVVRSVRGRTKIVGGLEKMA